MSGIWTAVDAWFQEGGPLMGVLAALGLVLYGVLFWKMGRVFGASDEEAGDPAGAASEGPAHGGQGDLLLIRALIGAAPLLGLLGTVNGIILSFDGIVEGGAVERMSEGIGNALRTTQYGLAIAAPALLLERLLSRRIELRSQAARARDAESRDDIWVSPGAASDGRHGPERSATAHSGPGALAEGSG
ncbi:MAG: MotA/TolQ/ExbB proton channel family protein [Myxococcota bacterium]